MNLCPQHAIVIPALANRSTYRLTPSVISEGSDYPSIAVMGLQVGKAVWLLYAKLRTGVLMLFILFAAIIFYNIFW